MLAPQVSLRYLGTRKLVESPLLTPLDLAIAICGTQSELARRVTGKPATGYVYHWRRNGISEPVAVAIEEAVRSAISDDPAAAARAQRLGGAVLADHLLPDVEWIRDQDGRVVRYAKPVEALVRPEGESSHAA